MPQEKLYISSKLTLGVPMDERTFHRDIKGQDVITNQETREGYRVTYPGGYVSWSSKEAFEIANREVTQSELDLISPEHGRKEQGKTETYPGIAIAEVGDIEASPD